MKKKNKGRGKKMNNIKPGSICTLIHNDRIIFRITGVNDNGYPFSDFSIYRGVELEDSVTEGNHCVAYTDLYREATYEEMQIFFDIMNKYNDSKNSKKTEDMKNCIENLPVKIYVDDDLYILNIHPNAWFNLVITYRKFNDPKKYLCSVCVEPDHEPVLIEDTIGYFNEYIGNAKTLDDAAKMIYGYICSLENSEFEK